MHPRNAEREVVPVVDESVWLAANRLRNTTKSTYVVGSNIPKLRRLLQSQSDCQTRLMFFFFFGVYVYKVNIGIDV